MFILSNCLEQNIQVQKDIESLKRTSGTRSDFVVELPETVQHEITIPHSWYGISTGFNDSIEFDQNDTGNAFEDYRQFALRQGLYTSDQLSAEIKNIG